MPGAYSADPRERVLPACARGGLSRAGIAKVFQVAEGTTVHRRLQTWRTEARRQAKPHAGGPAPRPDAAALAKLETIVAEANDPSLAEHAAGLLERTGVTASGPTVRRAPREPGLPRKKDPARARAGSRGHRRRPRRWAGRWAGRPGRARPAAAGLPG
jgi:transposase